MADETQVPVPAADADELEVLRFAGTYNGYEHHDGFRGCADLSLAVHRHFNETGELPHDVDVLRNGLFFSARARRHGGGYEKFTESAYVRASVARIGELAGATVPDKLQPATRPPLRTSLDPAQLDRAIGVLLGTAAGDALGAGYEFGPPLPDTTPVDMVGGGQFNWAPGEWTDDTSMAVVIAKVAAEGGELLGESAKDRIVAQWTRWAEGAKDVGVQTREILAAQAKNGSAENCREEARKLHERTGRSGGNGSLMRTAPVALAYLDDPDAMAAAARKVSVLTHYDPVAGDACALWCLAIGHAVLTGQIDARIGLNRLAPDAAAYWAARLDEAEAAPPAAFVNNGWVVHALQGAWSAIHGTGGPEHLRLGLQAAVRGGRDTDTVAAITGGLLGAGCGASAIPERWRGLLHGWPGLRSADLTDLAMQIVGKS